MFAIRRENTRCRIYLKVKNFVVNSIPIPAYKRTPVSIQKMCHYKILLQVVVENADTFSRSHTSLPSGDDDVTDQIQRVT